MQSRTSLTDPSIPYWAYFLAVVKDYGSPHHVLMNEKYTILPVPDYKEAVSIFHRHHSDDTGLQRIMAWIEESYAFIREGIELQLLTCSLQEVHLIADQLAPLQELKTQYETGWIILSIRHDDNWIELPADQKIEQGEYFDGTEDLRNAMAMKYAAWLIGETTALVERRLKLSTVPGDLTHPQVSTKETLLATAEKKSKKPPARPFVKFTDKLQNGFTEEDLNGLLIHVKFKDESGETLRFTRYLMHQVIEALVKEEYFDRGTVEYDQKALSRYLGLSETRVTVEQGKPKKSVQKKAESYLSELKNQRKING